MNMFELKAIKTILVPTDFSVAATNAVNYAAMISKVTGARIILLHVNELPALLTNEQALAADFTLIEKDIQKHLDEIRLQLIRDNDIEVVCHTALGLTIPEIKDEVEKERVDLVLMGTKGAHGWKELLIGSQTSKVIEKCKCPILVLPENSPIEVPKRIAYATNFNDHEMQAFFLLVELMRPFNPEIMILHVSDSHDERLDEKKMRWFQSQVKSNISYDNFTFHELHGPSVELALDEYIKLNRINMLASAKRKRHFFDRFTSRSLTTDLAHHLTIPLLVFHIEAHAGTPVF